MTAESHAGIPRANPQAGLCCLTANNTPQTCPQGKPSAANHAVALLRFLQLLTTQDICVYSVTHNGAVFPGRAPSLPHSWCLPCVHRGFSPLKVCTLLFSAPSPCAKGNSCSGTHGKDCRNISCWSKGRLLQQKNT